MDAVLGLAFTRTGPLLYPVFGTLLGWLGVALTGSDTSSNILFGNLQTITARKLGLSPFLMASANTTGGVMGKMIDAQSIVVAAVATGEAGREGELLRAVFRHSILLALVVGGIVWVYAHLLPGVVPVPPRGEGPDPTTRSQIERAQPRLVHLNETADVAPFRWVIPSSGRGSRAVGPPGPLSAPGPTAQPLLRPCLNPRSS